MALVRRVLRIVLNVATVVLAALCLTAAGWWVRSYWASELVAYSRAADDWAGGAFTTVGAVHVWYSRGPANAAWVGVTAGTAGPVAAAWPGWAGSEFAGVGFSRSGGGAEWKLRVPLAYVVAVFAVVPVVRGFRRYRRGGG